MVKRFCVIMVALVLLVGCSSNEKPEVVATLNINNSTEIPVHTETPSPTNKPTVTPKPVKYDKAFKAKVKKAMQECTYVDVTQSTGLSADNKSSQVLKISYDCKNNICYTYIDLSFGLGIGNGTYEYISDFDNNLYYEKRGKKWKEQTDSVSVVDLPYSKLNSAYDVFRELVPSLKLKNGYKKPNGIIEFKRTVKAKKSDLTSSDYDKLGNKEIIIGYKSYKPVYYKVVVNYTVDGVSNTVSSAVKFKNYSKKQLSVRKLIKKK